MQLIPRTIQVDLMLKVLLYLGGVGTGIGGWVGVNYVFEPYDVSAEIMKVQIQTPTIGPWSGLNSPNILINTNTDRLCRLRVIVTDKETHTRTTYMSPETIASSWRTVATDKNRNSWYTLDDGIFPDWIESIEVTTFKVGWDTELPIEQRKQKTVLYERK